MPIFDYKCKDCETVVEVLIKTEEDAPKECPSCNAKDTMVKQIGSSNIQLVGTGWYRDGYK